MGIGVQTHPDKAIACNAQEAKDAGYALCAVGQLLANIYRFPFEDEQIAFFKGFDAEDGDFVLQNGSCAEGIRIIRDYFSDDDVERSRMDAKNDFHKLFVGPDKLRAVPWSSSYVDAQGIFGPTEQEVRSVFYDHGFEIPEGRREPSDHIAYELQFLVDLQREALDAWDAPSNGMPERTRVLLKEVADFKARFMDIWVSYFLDKVQSGARVSVYKGVAELTAGFLELEQDYLGLSFSDSNTSSEGV